VTPVLQKTASSTGESAQVEGALDAKRVSGQLEALYPNSGKHSTPGCHILDAKYEPMILLLCDVPPSFALSCGSPGRLCRPPWADPSRATPRRGSRRAAGSEGGCRRRGARRATSLAGPKGLSQLAKEPSLSAPAGADARSERMSGFLRRAGRQGWSPERFVICGRQLSSHSLGARETSSLTRVSRPALKIEAWIAASRS